MKYFNEEAIRKVIAGDRSSLVSAFDWTATPEGSEYWLKQMKGETELDIKRLEEILKAGEGSKMSEVTIKVSEVVTLIPVFASLFQGLGVEDDSEIGANILFAGLVAANLVGIGADAVDTLSGEAEKLSKEILDDIAKAKGSGH